MLFPQGGRTQEYIDRMIEDGRVVQRDADGRWNNAMPATAGDQIIGVDRFPFSGRQIA